MSTSDDFDEQTLDAYTDAASRLAGAFASWYRDNGSGDLREPTPLDREVASEMFGLELIPAAVRRVGAEEDGRACLFLARAESPESFFALVFPSGYVMTGDIRRLMGELKPEPQA